MVTNREDNMWCLLMFDLPTLTKAQRSEASKFRNSLLDAGFFKLQLSVYARHARYATQFSKIVRAVKHSVPQGGEVRIAMITDAQWSSMFRFLNGEPQIVEERPSQLSIFC